jgi:heat shock protein HtpX
MATIYTHQDSNSAKTWLLMAVFLGLVIALGWFASQYYNSPGLLVGFVIFAVLMNIGSYWFSDKLVLSMSGAVPADEKTYGNLHNLVENLAITAGLPKPKLYIINDEAPNAFATGRNKEHAVVAVTAGLMQMLDKTELEGVLAHELSHVGNRDILLSTVVVVLVGFVALLSDFFIRASMFGGRDREDNKAGAFFMVAGIALAVLSPIIATLMQLAISRRREFLADASGALLTRYPEGLASALQKIASYSRPMQKANNATAHLFISNPFGGGKAKGFMVNLFSTHPPVEERVKALLGDKGE